MKHKSNDDTNYNWSTWNNPRRIRKGSGILGNKRTTALLRSPKIQRARET